MGMAELTAAATMPALPATVEVRIAELSPRLAGATACGVLWQADRDRFLLDVPGVARFLAREGRELTIDPAPRAEPERVARLARMTPLAALAWQQGLLAFHAAAVSRAGESVLLCGDSAVGKSTLAAWLLGRGWELVADELAIVELRPDGDAIVWPGAPELVLWPDVVERLPAAAAARLELPDGVSGPCVAAAGDAAVTKPQPLRAVWWLNHHHLDEVETAPLSGGERVRALTHRAYNTQVAAALVERARHLSQLVALSAPMQRLERPRRGWSAERLAESVERGA
jgi:hypothetical protein